eukprot:gene26891-29568_t
MAETTRTILITGSTDGVGRRVAERLAAPDTRILIHGRDRDRGESLVQAIIKSGGEAAFYSADLSALSEVRELSDTILRDHSRLDVLINNAGYGLPRSYAPTTRSEQQAFLQVMPVGVAEFAHKV